MFLHLVQARTEVKARLGFNCFSKVLYQYRYSSIVFLCLGELISTPVVDGLTPSCTFPVAATP